MQVDRELVALASEIISRSKLADNLGLSYDQERDLYKALGYTKAPQIADYRDIYLRQDIAKRIVEAPVSASWKKKPTLIDLSVADQSRSKFISAWKRLVVDFSVWHFLFRLDKISGIGRYGVLLIGVNDPGALGEPISGKRQLLYLCPYQEANASVNKTIDNKDDPLYGMPESYSVKVKTAMNSTSSATILVHHTRTIHVAEGLIDDNTYGTPRLEPVLNRLSDLEKVVGGSAEMFWRGAYQGWSLEADKDATLGVQEKADLEDEIQKYMHNLQRYVRLRGIQMKSLAGEVADPSGHVSVILDLIAGATGIPKRILVGSERGELASSQDERNWADKVESRREDHVEPVILRPFISKMVELGVLPKPSEGYEIVWPPLSEPTEEDRAEVGRKRAETLAKYVTSPGAELVIPVELFLSKYLGFSQDEIERARELVEGTTQEDES